MITASSRATRCLLAVVVWSAVAVCRAEPSSVLYRDEFSAGDYGRTPTGWTDREPRRASRAWMVDDRGFLRQTHKNAAGLLTYDGYLANAKPARHLADALFEAEFKLADAEQWFGLAARIEDAAHHYLARFGGGGLLELQCIDGEQLASLASLSASTRYREGEIWRLQFELRGERLTARVFDAAGRETARVDALDGRFANGPGGVRASTYGVARSFSIRSLESFEPTYDRSQMDKRNARLAVDEPNYPVVRPVWQSEPLNSQPKALADDYDVVVAGAGTGGLSAALQAARLGARVLLIDETDWIGGQMAAAAVSSMDEDSVYGKFPVRERGLYREFHESMVAYYRSLDKEPFVAYYGNPQLEGGYEPKAVRAVLYGLIAETRGRTLSDGTKSVLDVCLRSRVAAVKKRGETIVGATIAHEREGGSSRRDIACRVLVDATEYGDVIPLTGARYRVSNTTSDAPKLESPLQDHTWVAVVREYPEGVPEHLRIHEPPPDYEAYAAKRFRKFQHYGIQAWGAAAKEIKGPRNYRVYFAWRGMADTESPLVGAVSGRRHTQCGFNGGNDYPVTVATCEDAAQRLRDERFGIERTLGTLYYFQQELGLNWSLADDEGFDTPYNRARMKARGLRPDLEALAVHLPQLPYVRESRRIVGVETLRAADLTRYDAAKHVATSIAMGDYFMDLDHGRTAHVVETDLDSGEPPRGGGPFQVPLAAFLPETLDGFLPAEKNFSQSRLANGATRLQPITMLTGQAVGTMAALAVRRKVKPRELRPLAVQSALLDSGSTLIQRWYADVRWGTPLWKATQLLSLHGVLDRPGAIAQDVRVPLGAGARWGVAEPISADEVRSAVSRLATLAGMSVSPPAIASAADPTISVHQLRTWLAAVDPTWAAVVESATFADPASVTAGEFAIIAAEVLLQTIDE